jgi:hypothetical protein
VFFSGLLTFLGGEMVNIEAAGVSKMHPGEERCEITFHLNSALAYNDAGDEVKVEFLSDEQTHVLVNGAKYRAMRPQFYTDILVFEIHPAVESQ